jgi:predicted RecA/RadA family phage recombinase
MRNETMEAEYIQVGDRIDYTPSGAVAVGDVVVQGDLVGVALEPIAASVLGSLAVSGVFDMAKATTSDSALTVGTKVYWNASADVVTAPVGSNKLVGKVVKAAAADDETVWVRLSQ